MPALAPHKAPMATRKTVTDAAHAPLYLDWNASAPVLPQAREAAIAWMSTPGNPSSVHGFGRQARARIEDARQAVAHLAGASRAAQVIFTSGGTEALALALYGLLPAHDLAAGQSPPPHRRHLISAVEHPAVHAAAHAAGSQAAEVIPVHPSGLVNLDWLRTRLSPARDDLPAVVTVQYANNETGVLQPIAAIAEMVHCAGALLVCDAVQAAGKVPLSLAELGADALALSAHKIGGLPGSGALVLRAGMAVRPLLAGGGQERGQRGGTPNGPGIVAFGAAAAHALTPQATHDRVRMTAQRDRIIAEITAHAPEVTIHGLAAPRLPNTLSLALPGVDQQRQIMALDLAKIAISAGSACSSGKVAPSSVLLAMGIPESLARQSIRVSFGPTTHDDELNRFVSLWLSLRST